MASSSAIGTLVLGALSAPPAIAPRQKKLPKNAAGNRSDVAWKHGVADPENPRKITCKYCQKTVSGGVYRLKHHLAGTQRDVEPCKAVPDEIQKEMLQICAILQENLIKKTEAMAEEEKAGVGEKRMKSSNSGNMFKKRCFSSQPTINTVLKKGLRDDACQAIARFFYNNAISFNVARSEEFNIMCDMISRHGNGFKPPSYYDIRVKLLNQEVKSTNDALEEHRREWKKTGCTIMTDGWTDRRRRTILNFLVNSPRGTVFLKSVDASNICKTAEKIFEMIDAVVEEVGEDNVVQVVTDNAANYKAAGEMLMRKRKKLYWTPCAAHCLDLMLEDLEKKIPIHGETIPKGKKITTFIYARTSLISILHSHTKNRDLVRPGATRFATSYLTLGCLFENKEALIRMFTSKEWKSSKCAKLRDGKALEDMILDKKFWKDIVICLKGATPLMKVLRLADSDKKPAMGFIYEAMDQANSKEF